MAQGIHDGNAWGYFSHDQSPSRAYRWGEDGPGGISDDKQRLGRSWGISTAVGRLRTPDRVPAGGRVEATS
jgi:hypothetical protein